MLPVRTRDFELILGGVPIPSGDGKRHFVQAYSPAGVSSREMDLDVTDSDFANEVSVASGEGPNLDGRKATGKRLFDRLFHGPVGSLWDQSVGQLSAGGFDRLRVRLWIADPGLSMLPWELLTWNGTFLATRSDMTLSRYLPGPEPSYLQPVETIEVLVVVCRPKEGHLDPIPDSVVASLQASFAPLAPKIRAQVLHDPEQCRSCGGNSKTARSKTFGIRFRPLRR
jgi:hypothetical protein